MKLSKYLTMQCTNQTVFIQTSLNWNRNMIELEWMLLYLYKIYSYSFKKSYTTLKFNSNSIIFRNDEYLKCLKLIMYKEIFYPKLLYSKSFWSRYLTFSCKVFTAIKKKYEPNSKCLMNQNHQINLSDSVLYPLKIPWSQYFTSRQNTIGTHLLCS